MIELYVYSEDAHYLNLHGAPTCGEINISKNDLWTLTSEIDGHNQKEVGISMCLSNSDVVDPLNDSQLVETAKLLQPRYSIQPSTLAKFRTKSFNLYFKPEQMSTPLIIYVDKKVGDGFGVGSLQQELIRAGFSEQQVSAGEIKSIGFMDDIPMGTFDSV